MFPKMFLLADLFWLRNITTDPHILADVNIACSVDRHLILTLCISEMIFDNTSTYQ